MWAKAFILFLMMNSFVHTDTFKQHTRDSYVKSLKSRLEGERLLAILAKQEQTAFVLGYTGATKMILAKHAFNPFVKLAFFNAGKRQLEAAIMKDSQNVELVFLRYATQVSAPSILNYTQHLAADRKFILQTRTDKYQDEQLRHTIRLFMMEQKLTAEEKQQLLNISK